MKKNYDEYLKKVYRSVEKIYHLEESLSMEKISEVLEGIIKKSEQEKEIKRVSFSKSFLEELESEQRDYDNLNSVPSTGDTILEIFTYFKNYLEYGNEKKGMTPEKKKQMSIAIEKLIKYGFTFKEEELDQFFKEISLNQKKYDMNWELRMLLLEKSSINKNWNVAKLILSTEKHSEFVKKIISYNFEKIERVELLKNLINNAELNWKQEETNNFSEYNAIIKSFKERYTLQLAHKSLVEISKDATWISRKHVILDIKNHKIVTEVISETPEEAQERICKYLCVKKINFSNFEIGDKQAYNRTAAERKWTSIFANDLFLLIKINTPGIGKNRYSSEYVGHGDYYFNVSGKYNSGSEGLLSISADFQYCETHKQSKHIRPSYHGNRNLETLNFKIEK